jgi:hypothetical protein
MRESKKLSASFYAAVILTDNFELAEAMVQFLMMKFVKAPQS